MNFIDHSKQVLRDNSYRLTEPRIHVIEVLGNAVVPLNAYGISDHIRATGMSIDTVTVYRIIEVLEKLKLVHKVRGGYSACKDFTCSKKDHCHHQFLCRMCKCIQEIHLDDKNFINSLSKKFPRLSIDAHYFEFSGICGGCKN